MKKKLVPFVLLAMVLGFVYVRFSAFRPRPAQVRIAGVTVKVDIADTIGKQRQGLSGRDSLAPEEGMYFPMGPPAVYSFWMKEMRFPLDIIWIRAGRVVDISENVPHPIGEHPPVSVRPKESADAVLEVNADFTEKHGVKIGDEIRIAK